MANINDVARVSGVSKATVSYVLNNGPRNVKPETRDRVLKAIQELNYHPSAIARGLTNKRVNSIGLITLNTYHSPIDDPYYSAILAGVIDTATTLKQSVTIFNGTVWSDTNHRIPVFCDGRCDGLLLVTPNLDNDAVPTMKRLPIPFVVVNDGSNEKTLSSIDIDNVSTAKTIVSYLISKGHQRIAYFAGASNMQHTEDRRLGYQMALQEACIPYDHSLIVSGRNDIETGYSRTLAWLPKADPKPTAIFAGCDSIAIGVMQALRELNINVPEDISIVGIDGINGGLWTDPPITTMDQQLREVGVKAVHMLMTLIDSPEKLILKEIQPTTLIERKSVASQ